MNETEKELIKTALRFYRRHTVGQIRGLTNKFGIEAIVKDKVKRIMMIDHLINKLKEKGEQTK